jgi:T-complex protein 1 subunit theta
MQCSHVSSDDAVSVFKATIRDGRLVPGAGAMEVELAKRLQPFGEECPGLDQVGQ